MWYSHIFNAPDYSDRVPDFSIFSLLKALLQNEFFVNLHFPVFSTNWIRVKVNLYLYKSKTRIYFTCFNGGIFFVHLQLDRCNLCCQSWVLIQCTPAWDRKSALNFSKEWSKVLDAVNVNEPASVFVVFGIKLFKSNNNEWSVQGLNVGITSKWESPLDVHVCMCV